MTKTISKKALGAGALAALLASTAHQAYAAEFVLGEGVTAVTNVTLKAGVSVRTEEQDEANVFGGNTARVGTGVNGRALSSTNDDGNLNFDRGDIVNAPLSFLGDVDINVDNTWGVFVRAKAVTDLAVEFQEVAHGHGPNGYQQDAELNDETFAVLARASTAELLDAFAYVDFDVADKPITFRLGRQVVSWGESALIQGGINSINPIDVSAFRRPGVDLKEGLLPVGMAYINVGLFENISVEGFLQYEHQQTVVDGCGTFFSTTDIVAEGCSILTLGPDDGTSFATGTFIRRGADVEPDQYAFEQGGVALRYYSPDLDTEFGAYWHRTHSNAPIVGFYQGEIPAAALGAGVTSAIVATDGIAGTVATRYAEQIVEDIDLFGLSAATNILGLAVAGEVSYRPDQPVQINGNQLTAAAAAPGLDPTNPANDLFVGPATGQYVEGFSEAQQLRGQMSAVAFVDQVLGASRWTLLAEAGFEHLKIDDRLPGLQYGRSSDYGDPRATGEGGLITPFSWGYRLRASGAYPDVYGGVNLTPSITFSHDVDGTSSDGQFNDNRKGVGLGLTFDYLNTYSLSLNYTNFFDGDFDVLTDRDFASATAQVQF